MGTSPYLQGQHVFSMRHLSLLTFGIDFYLVCLSAYLILCVCAKLLPSTDKELKKLLGLLKQVYKLMQPQKRSTIKDKGRSVGMGSTRKYDDIGRPYELYLLKLGKVRRELGDTMEEAFPEIYKQTTKFAQKLEAILAMIYPLAVLERYSSCLLYPKCASKKTNPFPIQAGEGQDGRCSCVLQHRDNSYVQHIQLHN
jgi:hypothetical protein